MSGRYVLSVSAYSTVCLHSEVNWAYTEMGIVDRGGVILKVSICEPVSTHFFTSGILLPLRNQLQNALPKYSLLRTMFIITCAPADHRELVRLNHI